MTKAKSVCLVAAALACAAVFAGCAESREVRVTPAWSATLPAEDAVWAKTVNVFPFYSKNQTAFVDRIEESGNVLLFISWSKSTPRLATGLSQKVEVTASAPEARKAEPAEALEAEKIEAAEAEEAEAVEAPAEDVAE